MKRKVDRDQEEESEQEDSKSRMKKVIVKSTG